jgi:adenylate kinase
MSNTKCLNLFIIGPSGCGKSTQAKLLAQKYSLTHISTGQLFRDEIIAQTPLGIQAREYIDRGVWVPNPLVIQVLTQKLQSIGSANFIVDGTPRKVGQCPALEEFLHDQGQELTLLIHLDVPYDEIAARRARLGMNFQDTSRTDLDPQDLQRRQHEYEKYNQPILDYFRAKDKLLTLDGNRPIQPIFEDICKKIESLNYLESHQVL